MNETANRKARISGPLRQCFSSAVMRNQSGSPRILNLLTTGRPSNISRLIVAAIVDTVNRVFRRWWVSDVCVKLFKTLKLILDAAIEVPSSASMIRTAPHLYVPVGAIDLTIGHPVSLDVAPFFILQASTAIGFAVSKVGRLSYEEFPAITLAFPCGELSAVLHST